MADEPKPGWKTSEGIGTAGIIGAVVLFRDHFPEVPPVTLFWGCVVLAVAYTISRALVKARTIVYESDPEVKALGEEIRKLRK